MYVSPLGAKGTVKPILRDVLRILDFGDYYKVCYFPELLRPGFQCCDFEETLFFERPDFSDLVPFFDELNKTKTTDCEFEPPRCKSESVVSRAKRTIYELSYMNPWDYFITITVSSQAIGINRYDLKSCKKRILKLFQNFLGRYFPGFKYLLLPEQHKDGAWHFHGFIMIDDRFLTLNSNGYLDWTYISDKVGFVSLDKIRNKDACAKYCTKYMNKSLAEIVRDIGEHMYYCSKGLERPRLVHKFAGCGNPDNIFSNWDFVGDSGYRCKNLSISEYERFLSSPSIVDFEDFSEVPF